MQGMRLDRGAFFFEFFIARTFMFAAFSALALSCILVISMFYLLPKAGQIDVSFGEIPIAITFCIENILQLCLLLLRPIVTLFCAWRSGISAFFPNGCGNLFYCRVSPLLCICFLVKNSCYIKKYGYLLLQKQQPCAIIYQV